MTVGEKQRIFTLNIAKLITFAYEKGYELSFGEVFRPQEMQEIYFRTGRSKTMNSRHLQRLAVDLNLFLHGLLMSKPIEYKPLGDYWITLHSDNIWGGDWDRDGNIADETFLDPYHFEMKP